MTDKASLAVTEVIRQSRLAVVKLTNEIVVVVEKGEQVLAFIQQVFLKEVNIALLPLQTSLIQDKA